MAPGRPSEAIHVLDAGTFIDLTPHYPVNHRIDSDAY